MPTQLPPELIELVCPIPPVATFVSGDFTLPEIDNPSILYDADIGYTIVSADAFVAFQTILADDLSTYATQYTNINSMAARVLNVPTTRVGPQGSYKDGSGYYTQDGSRALNASTLTPGTPNDSNAVAINQMLNDWSTTMSGTPTVPAPTADVVVDPTTPVGWFSDDTIVHGIRWKMLKQYCQLSGGGSQYGTDSTPGIKLVGSFDSDLRPRLRDLSPGAMPLVWTDDGHLYLCCAVPLQVGKLRYVCELQLWNRDATDSSTALAAADVDQFFADNLLATTGTTDWLLRQQPVKFEDVAGLVYEPVDLSLYSPLPLNRSGCDIRGGQYGADFGYFWVYDGSRMYKFSTTTLQVAPLSTAGSIPTGGSISPVATEVGSGTMARWEYTFDDTLTAVWGDYYSSVPIQHLSMPDDDTIDVSGAGFTLTPFFTLCLPISYGETLDGPIPKRNWKQAFTNGFTGFIIDGSGVAGIETPYPDYSDPTVPQPTGGPYPFRYPAGQPLSTAGVDVVTCSTNHVVTWGPAWGMWPDRHWYSDKQVLCDETTLSIRDAPMNVSVNSSTSHDLSVTLAPYKTFSSSAIGGEANYLAFTFPDLPLPHTYSPAAGYSVAFNDFKWHYLQFTSTQAPHIALVEVQAQRFCSDLGAGPVVDTTYTFSESAFLVNGTIQTSGGSTFRTGINNTTTFTVDNFDGNHVSITPPTVAQVPFREIVNCGLHIGGFYIAYDGSATTSFPASTTTVTFDIETLVYEFATDTITVLDTFSQSITYDPAASNGMTLMGFGDSITNRISADSFLALPTEYGVYVRLKNLVWDRANLPISPTIDVAHEGHGNTIFFSISLVNTGHTYNYFAPVSTKTNVKGAMSWPGTITRPWTPTYSGTSLPSGSSLSSSTGHLSGTAAGVGPHYPIITATHTEGAANYYYPIAGVDAFSAQYTTEDSDVRRNRESAIRLNWFDNNGSWKRGPDEIAAEGLPPGMFLDATSGVIRGVPTREGVYGVKLVAHWIGRRFGMKQVGIGGGTDSRTLTVVVGSGDLWADQLFVTSPTYINVYAGQPFQYIVETIGEVTTYSITGLPSGLSATGGIISGTWTPGAVTLEDYADVTVHVTRGIFSHSIVVRFRLVQVLSCPVFYWTGVDGTSGIGPNIVWQLTTEQPVPGLIQWSASGLPTGLTLDANSGVISGIPTSSATYTPNITVTGPDAVARTQQITIEVATALDGRITQGSGWAQIVIAGTTVLSSSPAFILPSPWLSGLQVVRPIPAVYAGSPLAFGATGSCVVNTSNGGDVTVTFRSAAMVGTTPTTIFDNTGGGAAQYYILTIVPYTSQDTSNLPSVPDFLGEYYLVLEGQLGPYNDVPGIRYSYWNTTATSDYFTAIQDWLDNWPAAGMFFGTVSTPAASDSIQRIWFDKDARRQNPGCLQYLDYVATDTKPKTW